MKTCTRCRELKSATDFSRDIRSRDGLSSHCKQCRNLWVLNYRKTRKATDPAYKRLVNLRISVSSKLRAQWLRSWVLAMVSDARLECAACGTTDDLQIDHIHEDGHIHRSSLGMCRSGGNGYTSQSRYYKSMLETGCKGLQCLCGKCNVIKSQIHHLSHQSITPRVSQLQQGQPMQQ